jgi:hypothetical protein
MKRKRGLNTENARIIRQKGYDDALEFAVAIGLDNDYKNDIKAKKDVIDPSGDAHSVKSGEKKWQRKDCDYPCGPLLKNYRIKLV